MRSESLDTLCTSWPNSFTSLCVATKVNMYRFIEHHGYTFYIFYFSCSRYVCIMHVVSIKLLVLPLKFLFIQLESIFVSFFQLNVSFYQQNFRSNALVKGCIDFGEITHSVIFTTNLVCVCIFLFYYRYSLNTSVLQQYKMWKW